MRIAIIGAGITGLTAAYRLSKNGHQVVIFEKANACGGLCLSVKLKNWDWPLESFFHHSFTSDAVLSDLLEELGLKDLLFYSRPKTSIYLAKDTSVFQFDSPLSLLKFPPLPFPDRLRTGLVTAYLKLLTNWQPLEQLTAYDWLSKYYGKRAFELLWRPLLVGKFGEYAPSINMAWFWARIKKRSNQLGYLKGGFQVLIDKLVEKIQENNREIYLNTKISFKKNGYDFFIEPRGKSQNCREPRPIFRGILSEFPGKIINSFNERFNSEKNCWRGDQDNLSLNNNFDKIIITTPTQSFLPSLPVPKMLGALNLILVLKKPFLTDSTYWLNINEPSFPFVAVVEHTNFIDKSHYGGNHILYVGGYYPQSHRYFKMTKQEIYQEFLPFLQQINPQFKMLQVTSYMLYVNLYAQPIIPINYSKSILPHQSLIPNIYISNLSQIYPWDRGINYSIELGEKISQLVLTD